MKAQLKIAPASISALQVGLLSAEEHILAATRAAFERSSENLFHKAVNSTPRRTGALAHSGQLHDKSSGSLLQSVVSFGTDLTNPENHKKTSEYAVLVHEEYHAEYPDSYKWLERTVNAYGEQQFINDLAEAIASALR